jgi:hypothetical protein
MARGEVGGQFADLRIDRFADSSREILDLGLFLGQPWSR